MNRLIFLFLVFASVASAETNYAVMTGTNTQTIAGTKTFSGLTGTANSLTINSGTANNITSTGTTTINGPIASGTTPIINSLIVGGTGGPHAATATGSQIVKGDGSAAVSGSDYVATNLQASRWTDKGQVLDMSGNPFTISEAFVYYDSMNNQLVRYCGNGGIGSVPFHRGTSTDGLHWVETGTCTITGGTDTTFSRVGGIVSNGTTYIFYCPNEMMSGNGGSIRVASSSDGYNFTYGSIVLPTSTNIIYANCRVFYDTRTGLFTMLAEQANSSLHWKNALVTAPTPLGPWTIQRNGIRSLSITGFANDSESTSPCSVGIVQNGASIRYYTWANCNRIPSYDTTDALYFTSSCDLLYWRPLQLAVDSATQPNLSGITGFCSQIADPFFIEVPAWRKCFLYYTVVDNTQFSSHVRVFNGSLAELVAGTDNPPDDGTQWGEGPLTTARMKVIDGYSNYPGNDGSFIFQEQSNAHIGDQGGANGLGMVEGFIGISSTASSMSIQIAPPPRFGAGFHWVIQVSGRCVALMEQDTVSGAAATYYSESIPETQGSGWSSTSLAYVFNTNFSANAGDTIVMSPSGHTFTVDATVVSATSTNATTGGVRIRRILGGSKPLTSDTTLTVNGGIPIATTYVKNSASGGADFGFVFFSNSTGVHFYNPNYVPASFYYKLTFNP